MAVRRELFHWDGQYYERFSSLPLNGLKALLNELKQAKAMQGYTFKDNTLLEDVEREIYARTGKRY